MEQQNSNIIEIEIETCVQKEKKKEENVYVFWTNNNGKMSVAFLFTTEIIATGPLNLHRPIVLFVHSIKNN